MKRMKAVLTKEMQEYLLKLIEEDAKSRFGQENCSIAVDTVKALTVHGMPEKENDMPKTEDFH